MPLKNYHLDLKKIYKIYQTRKHKQLWHIKPEPKIKIPTLQKPIKPPTKTSHKKPQNPKSMTLK
jgi:hypothetical protein